MRCEVCGDTYTGGVCRTCKQKRYEELMQDPARRARHTEMTKINHKKHPERLRARQQTRQLIKSGKLDRPVYCQECGTFCTPQAHHPDYSRPDLVRFLCAVCHRLEHKKEKDQCLNNMNIMLQKNTIPQWCGSEQRTKESTETIAFVIPVQSTLQVVI